jgi:hypothetical protein
MFQNKIKTFGRDLLLVIDRVSAMPELFVLFFELAYREGVLSDFYSTS